MKKAALSCSSLLCSCWSFELDPQEALAGAPSPPISSGPDASAEPRTAANAGALPPNIGTSRKEPQPPASAQPHPLAQAPRPSQQCDDCTPPSLATCGLRGLACCGGTPECAAGLHCEEATGVCASCRGFRPLGLPVGHTDARALAVSADGSVAVGRSRAQRSENLAAMWHLDHGLVTRFGGGSSSLLAISDDGRTVVGFESLRAVIGGIGTALENAVTRAFPGPVLEAFLAQNVARGVVVDDPVAHLFQGRATGVSRSGEVVVGWREETRTGSVLAGSVAEPRQGFLRSSGGDFLPLGAEGYTQTEASAVSGDGRYVVGWGTLSETGDDRALLWSEGGALSLGTLPGGLWSRALAVNADGTAVVGISDSETGPRAFARLQETQALLDLTPMTEALAVDGAGETIVGRAGDQAAIWRARTGEVRAIATELSDGIPVGWNLQAATGISDSGEVVVGYGSSPTSPVEQAWAAYFGAPCAVSTAVDAGPTEPRDAAQTTGDANTAQ